MKILATTLFFSLALASTGAHAAGAEHGKSGSQIAAELQEAKLTWQYTFGEMDYPAALPRTSSLTEQEVRAEIQQAKVNGEYTFGELDYPPVARQAAGCGRADIERPEKKAATLVAAFLLKLGVIS